MCQQVLYLLALQPTSESQRISPPALHHMSGCIAESVGNTYINTHAWNTQGRTKINSKNLYFPHREEEDGPLQPVPMGKATTKQQNPCKFWRPDSCWWYVQIFELLLLAEFIKHAAVFILQLFTRADACMKCVYIWLVVAIWSYGGGRAARIILLPKMEYVSKCK